jgi:hypothetical protein
VSYRATSPLSVTLRTARRDLNFGGATVAANVGWKSASAFRHCGQRRSPVSGGSSLPPIPAGRIEPLGHALTKRRMRPVCGMFHNTMLHRVEVRVAQVSRQVSIIADRVLPAPPLPNAAFATAGHGIDRDSRAGKLSRMPS